MKSGWWKFANRIRGYTIPGVLRYYLCLKEKKNPCHLKLDVVRLHGFFTIPHKNAVERKSGLQHNQEYNMFCDSDDANYFFLFYLGE